MCFVIVLEAKVLAIECTIYIRWILPRNGPSESDVSLREVWCCCDTLFMIAHTSQKALFGGKPQKYKPTREDSMQRRWRCGHTRLQTDRFWAAVCKSVVLAVSVSLTATCSVNEQCLPFVVVIVVAPVISTKHHQLLTNVKVIWHISNKSCTQQNFGRIYLLLPSMNFVFRLKHQIRSAPTSMLCLTKSPQSKNAKYSIRFKSGHFAYIKNIPFGWFCFAQTWMSMAAMSRT